MKNHIRLIALDLDGTLLDSHRQVSAAVSQQIDRARAMGVEIVLASARPPRSVRPIYDLLSLFTPSIHYNGALVFDLRRGLAIAHEPLPLSIAQDMLAHAESTTCVHAELLDRSMMAFDDVRFPTETRRLFTPDVVGPIKSWLTQDVTKLMFTDDSAAIEMLARSLINAFGEASTILHTEANLIQVTSRNASKGRALKTLAAQMGISMDCVMAVGDAANDVDMLRDAGVAVAMGNACGQLKVVAETHACGWISPTNDHDGVAAAIERFVT